MSDQMIRNMDLTYSVRMIRLLKTIHRVVCLQVGDP